MRFDLTGQGATTNLTLTHTGFPQGAAQGLAEGWKGNYFEPLVAYLG